MNKKFFRRKGFTLIEIMVVVGLIGILAGFLLVSLQGVRASARDAQRKSDLEAIQSALAMYKSTCGYYPSGVTSGSALVSTGTNGEKCAPNITFLSIVPRDPVATQSYSYTSIPVTKATTYSLKATLESRQILEVTPLTTNLLSPAPTSVPTVVPTATPTPCNLLPIGGNCKNSGDAQCCSGYCNNNYKCAVHP